jgi:hypothetical protein
MAAATARAAAAKRSASKPAALFAAIDRKTGEAKDRDVVATETTQDVGGNAGEVHGTGIDRIVAEDDPRAGGRTGHERLGAAGLVVLAGIEPEIEVDLVHAAVKGLSVVGATDRRLDPVVPAHRR